ncbi:interleukin-6 [Nannospalax galili]|uniref:Interleukin-6 n=1 Tax=Nannospalax galili TaxID=1026970 RepID=A0A8C6RKZ5_NANGA|nr:interleukin-6 [Nannospalax galili]
MKFLSTRTLHPLAFLGLLLVTATAFPASQVREEASTDDTTPNRPAYTTPQKMEGLISYVIGEISEIRTELCDHDENCLNNDEAFLANNLEPPRLTIKDGCFQTGYNRETCLLKVTSGLLEYQVYLEYIQGKLKDTRQEKVKNVQANVKTLIRILKQEIKNLSKVIFPSPTANASLLEKLDTQNEWHKTMAIHFILRQLENFLTTTIRAIREN